MIRKWLMKILLTFLKKGVELLSKVNRFIRDTLYQSKQQPGVRIIMIFKFVILPPNFTIIKLIMMC